MPKIETDYPHFIGLRISDPQKKDLLDINKQYAIPAREALMQYLPVMKMMQNPMAVPRDIVKEGMRMSFSVNTDGKFCVAIDGCEMELETESLRVLLANVFLFTLNTDNV